MEPIRVVALPTGAEGVVRVTVDPSNRWAIERRTQKQSRLWDLGAWPGARPLILRRHGSWKLSMHGFHPSGNWVVVSLLQQSSRVTFWPLQANRMWVVDGYRSLFRGAKFTPDGQSLATWWPDGTIRLWPLPGSAKRKVKTLTLHQGSVPYFWCIDSHSRFLVAGFGPFYVVPLDGSSPRELGDFAGNAMSEACAVSPSGGLVAAAPRYGEDKTLRVWDPEGSPSADPAIRGLVWNVSFADESTLFTDGDGGVRRWNLKAGTHELIYPVAEGRGALASFDPRARRALITDSPLDWNEVEEAQLPELVDLETGESRKLSGFGPDLGFFAAWDPSGKVLVAGSEAGIIRVGKVSGGEPHLLVGHEGPTNHVAISPDGRWIASTGEDDTLRLWRMPDLDKPPLHTLPHDEQIAKLQSLTNIRVVRDPDAEEGWSVKLDPFPGWGEVPTWQ